MQILIITASRDEVERLNLRIMNKLAVFCPYVTYYSKYLICIRPGIEILFKPAQAGYVRAMYPDYYWTNSRDADNYFKHRGIKKLNRFSEIARVVLDEYMSKTKEE